MLKCNICLKKHLQELRFRLWFYKNANRIYNCASPAGAVKGLVIYCTPSTVLYASLLTPGAACIVTGGNPLAISCFVNTGRLIVDA